MGLATGGHLSGSGSSGAEGAEGIPEVVSPQAANTNGDAIRVGIELRTR